MRMPRYDALQQWILNKQIRRVKEDIVESPRERAGVRAHTQEKKHMKASLVNQPLIHNMIDCRHSIYLNCPTIYVLLTSQFIIFLLFYTLGLLYHPQFVQVFLKRKCAARAQVGFPLSFAIFMALVGMTLGFLLQL